jgi:hypothetical protein
LEITRYNRADCQRLLGDEVFWAEGLLPTSRLRVHSYVNNPNVRDDDVLLYTAHKDGHLASYIAVLPDFIRATRDADLTPFGWPSSWWATQDMSLGPAASILLFKVLSDWRGAIALSGFSEPAKQVYDASRRFKDLKIFDYCAFAIQLPREFKGRRLPSAPVNALLRLKNRFYSSRANKNPVNCTLVDSIDEETGAFLTEQTRLDLFPRDGAFFDWLIKYPWVTCTTDEDRKPASEAHRYYFRCREERFHQLPIKLMRDDEVIGFLIFTLRDDYLILKYAIFEDHEIDAVKECIQAATIEYGAAFLWSADDRLNKALEGDRLFYLASKHFNYPFYIGKTVEYDTSLRLHYGLGDRVMC